MRRWRQTAATLREARAKVDAIFEDNIESNEEPELQEVANDHEACPSGNADMKVVYISDDK